MTKKSFAVILILSTVISYAASIIDSVVNNTLLAGESGFPFKDSRGTLFGHGTVNNIMLILNIVFWFAVISIAWKILQKIFKK